LKRTKWTRFYLDPQGMRLSDKPVAAEKSVSYEGLGECVTFSTPPLAQATEITGPSALKLWVSSATTDADVFAVLRVFDPAGKEVVFQGALDPHTPIAQGWLRASQRRLDKKLSKPYRPYHTHDRKEPLKPGQVYELDVEIWPTCIVAPAGYRIGLTVRGRDYEYPGGPSAGLGTLGAVFTGVGPFQHNDPSDRPPEVFGKRVTLHCGPKQASHLLVPVIPPK
jgi:predicted acyl esterase